VKVSADGVGVVSRAGVDLLREMAEEAHHGLVREVTAVLLDTYDGVPGHAPGRVFADLAVAIADGADSSPSIPTHPRRPHPGNHHLTRLPCPYNRKNPETAGNKQAGRSHVPTPANTTTKINNPRHKIIRDPRERPRLGCGSGRSDGDTPTG